MEKAKIFNKNKRYQLRVIIYASFSFLLFHIIRELLFHWKNISSKTIQSGQSGIMAEIILVASGATVAIFIILVAKSKVLKSIIVGLSLFLSNFCLIFFLDINIIITTWAFIFSAIIGIMIYLNKFDFIKKDINRVDSLSNPEDRKFLIDLVFQECKFYLDRSILALLALGAFLATVATIVWTKTEAYFMFYPERVIWSVDMAIMYMFIFVAMFMWIIVPIFNYISEVKTKIGNMKEDKRSINHPLIVDKDILAKTPRAMITNDKVQNKKEDV